MILFISFESLEEGLTVLISFAWFQNANVTGRLIIVTEPRGNVSAGPKGSLDTTVMSKEYYLMDYIFQRFMPP